MLAAANKGSAMYLEDSISCTFTCKGHKKKLANAKTWPMPGFGSGTLKTYPTKCCSLYNLFEKETI